MLSQPTNKRFLEAVQHTLKSSVGPAITSGDKVAARDAVVMLQAIDAILSSVVRRIDNEQRWIHEEIAQIEDLADAIVAAGRDAGGVVELGLRDLRSNKGLSEGPEGALADYGRASALLCLCAERAVVAGGPLRTKLDAVMEARLEAEGVIRGTFKTVGKD